MSARITEAMVAAFKAKFREYSGVEFRDESIRMCLAAALSTEAEGWQMIAEDAPQPPHSVPVLLWSPPSLGHPDGHIEARPYSSGRSGPGWSEVSYHGYATHWRPLPSAPGDAP